MNQQPTTSQELSGQCQHGMHGNHRVERIPDATVPIGSDLDLRQVYCEYVTGIFRNCSTMMLIRIAVSPSISSEFGQSYI
jgi:hypothetical protein